MARTVRNFLDDLGGYRVVAQQLGVASTTMHSYIAAEKLPPRWYLALCELARESGVMPPPPSLFDFKPLTNKGAA